MVSTDGWGRGGICYMSTLPILTTAEKKQSKHRFKHVL